jgi:hypothetical protein
MEGGVAILLLLIIFVVAGGFAVAMYLTGGALWFSRDKGGERDKPLGHPKDTQSSFPRRVSDR